MILKAIRLKNVRQFTDPVEVNGIGPGVNVLVEPNEHGKSTVFDALHAVFFRDRKAQDKRIKSLKPYAGGDPEVEVEIDLDGTAYRIWKCWKGVRGSVKVFREGTLFRQADEAEDWIKGVLQAPEHGGPAGLLWVRQGQGGLDRGSRREKESAQLARKNLLESAVSDEVDLMTGGRRMEVARKACEDELAGYVTATGRSRTHGPLARQENSVAVLTERLDDLKRISHKLHADLAERRQKRDELKRLQDPEADARLNEKLNAAKRANEAAQRHAGQLEQIKVKEHAKGLELDRVRDEKETLQSAKVELEEAQKACAEARQEHLAASEDLADKTEALAQAKSKRMESETLADTALRVLRRAEQKESIVLHAERRQELRTRLNQAEDAEQALEKAKEEEGRELSSSEGGELERLNTEVSTLRRSRDRESASVTMTYHPDAVGKVTLDGEPLEHDARVPIPEGAELGIEGVGTLTVNPDQRVDNGSLEAAEKRLRRLLLKHAVDDIAGARLSMQRRQDAEKRRRKAEALLRSVAPHGVDALKKKLAILPKKSEEESDDEPTLAQASAKEKNARTNRDACVETHERQRTRCAAAERKEATTAAALDGAQSRLSRAQVAIRGRDLSEEAARRQEKLLENLSVELQDLTLCRRELEDGAPDTEAVANRLARAKSVLDRARDEKVRLRIEIAKLDESIKIQDGDAVEEELGDIAEQLEHAEEELQNMRHEVKVLQRLARALEDAQQSARDRYVAPVLEELRPLIGLLWPKAQISFGAENILPETLERDGTKEDFSVLSGGTQEQIAILVRLAFARILAKSGSPAPVIFDDAIVYTDDYRIESMFDALTRQAQDHQIIVLSCRQRAFMDLGGIGLSIKAVTATG